jgi:hypothetical protein
MTITAFVLFVAFLIKLTKGDKSLGVTKLTTHKGTFSTVFARSFLGRFGECRGHDMILPTSSAWNVISIFTWIS